MLYKGSCHCGRVTYKVNVEPGPALECNCSICSRKGTLLWFTPHSKLHILTGENDLTIYTFGSHTVRHHFCRVCGCTTFGIGKPSGALEETVAINVRCLEEVILEGLERKQFDGRSL